MCVCMCQCDLLDDAKLEIVHKRSKDMRKEMWFQFVRLFLCLYALKLK